MTDRMPKVQTPDDYEVDHLVIRVHRTMRDARDRVRMYGVRTIAPPAETQDLLQDIAADLAEVIAAVNDKVEASRRARRAEHTDDDEEAA